MRASIILPIFISLLGMTVVRADGTTIDGTTVSSGQTVDVGATNIQSGGDVTGTAGASGNAAAPAVGASVIDKVWLFAGAGLGVVAGGLAFGL